MHCRPVKELKLLIRDFNMSSLLKKNSYCSKSLPPVEFQVCISSSDSGIDSDVSPVSSTNITTFKEFHIDIEEDDEEVSPSSFLLGENVPEHDRIEGINKALSWIKDELIKMKITDRQLAKSMITIRSKIAEQKLHLEKICDTGYDSDVDAPNNENKARWKLLMNGGFPASASCFDSNKRATWAI